MSTTDLPAMSPSSSPRQRWKNCMEGEESDPSRGQSRPGESYCAGSVARANSSSRVTVEPWLCPKRPRARYPRKRVRRGRATSGIVAFRPRWSEEPPAQRSHSGVFGHSLVPRLRRAARLVDQALVPLAVHLDHDGLFEAEVANEATLALGRLGLDPVPVDEALAVVGVDREVADLERGQVLEEMAALRGRDPEILEAGLDDDAGPGDLIPGHRDAEPGI